MPCTACSSHGRPVRLIVFLLALTLMLAAQPASAQMRMATVSGNCQLADASDHTGSVVIFTAQSAHAVTDSVTTDHLGSYTAGLAEGTYNVTFEHEGYIPVTLPEDYVFVTDSYVLPDAVLEPGTVIDVSGEVHGDWTSDFLFRVTDDITVPADSLLVIHPGTRVEFWGESSLIVYGELVAAGAEEDSVVFRPVAASTADFWGGITFGGDGFGSLDYCVVDLAGSEDAAVKIDSGVLEEPVIISNTAVRRSGVHGVELYRDDVVISDCIVELSSDHGIVIWDVDPLLLRNTVRWNGGCGLYTISPSEATILMNDFHGNALGGMSASYAHLRVSNNRFVGNTGSGVTLWADQSVFEGNVVAGNYHGVSRWSADDLPTILRNNTVTANSGFGLDLAGTGVVVENNIVTGNGYGVRGDVPLSTIQYNNVWGNSVDYDGDLPPSIGDPVTTNPNGDPCDIYNNISLDPLFVDVDDYTLQAASPCIDAGSTSSPSDPDGSIADMGAFPFFQGDPAAPEVDFTVSTTSGTAPLPVEFTHQNTGGPIIGWLWDFGDGCTSTQPNPVHTYVVNDLTAFTVSLIVTGLDDQTDVVSYPDLIVVAPGTSPPQADFTAEPVVSYGCVQFSNRSLGAIDSYLWDFGDGLQSTQQNPEHCYAVPGTYTVALTVSGPSGSDQETKVDYITILPADAIVAGFTAAPDFGVPPLAVAFTSTSIGTIDTYAWDFGDGSASDLRDPVHTFTEVGDYTVVLTASGPGGSDTFAAPVTVVPAAPVITDISDVPDDQGLQVYLTFARSGHDTSAPRSEIYTVQRRDGDVWVTVLSGGAFAQPQYTFLVPTLRDSTADDPGLTEFRVLASMDEGNFLGEAASGYSVDDLAPSAPSSFRLTYAPENHLEWQASQAPDLAWYDVHRASNPGFEPGPENLVHRTQDLSWVDPDGTWGDHYLLLAVDDAGNQSEAVEPDPLVGADHDELPARTGLVGNTPNPFNPTTAIVFELAAPAPVTLRIFDIAGRQVRHLLGGEAYAAGRHEVVWRGRDEAGRAVASGTYFYRMESGGVVEMRSMTLVR